MNDMENWTWSWLGPGTKKKNCTYYDQVQVVRSSDKSHRVYETGHTVYVANDEKQLWVAQIVEMYQVRTDLEDEECVLVKDKSAPAQEMRCTLRWFYNADDESIADSKRVSPHIPKPVKNEVYFSDHVEDGKSNHLDVIEGRAFLCATEHEMMRFHEIVPMDYRKGDAVCLVRCFYGYNAGNPPPIRELAGKELEIFLNNPSRDPDLYNASKAAVFGRHGAVMKGTGKKRRHRSTVSLDDAFPSCISNITADTAEDDIRKIARNPSTGHFEVSDQNSFSMRNFSGNDSDYTLITDSLSSGNSGRLKFLSDGSELTYREMHTSQCKLKPTFENETFPRNETEKKKAAVCNCSSAPEKRKKQRPVHVDATEHEQTGALWMKFQEVLTTGTREQQKHFCERIPELIQTFLKVMDDCDLEFDMSEDSKKAVANIAAKNCLVL